MSTISGYGIKYSISFYAFNGSGSLYTLNIHKKSYVGTSSPFHSIPGSLKVSRRFDNLDFRILGMSLSLTILNNEQNHFLYDELMFSKERQFIVELSNLKNSVTTIIFQGYLNTEAIQQKYLRYQELAIVASSYLSKLEYSTIPSIEGLQNDVFINIIRECLSTLGFNYPIMVCSSLKTKEDYGQFFGYNHTLLNRTGLYKEVFWKDDTERDNCQEILRKILDIFDLYLYWWDNVWYIEHFSNIRKTTKYFNKYIYGVSYSPTVGPAIEDTVSVNLIPKDIHSFTFIEKSHLRKSVPGLRQLNIKLDEYQKYLNYISNYFINAQGTATPVPIAPLRQWLYYTGYNADGMSWTTGFFGSPISYNGIQNAILRGISEPRFFGDFTGASKRSRGLFTYFKMRVLPNSTLQISFKYGFKKSAYFNYQKQEWSDPDSEDRLEPFSKYSHYRWGFPFYIMVNPFPEAPNYSTPMIALVWGENTGEWSKTTLLNNPPEQVDEFMYDSYVVIRGDDFNQANDVALVSINVPVGELLGDMIEANGWDFGFVFCLGTEIITNEYRAENPYIEKVEVEGYEIPNPLAKWDVIRATPAQIAYFGDFVIESQENNEITEPNVYEGSINEDYLSKEELTVSMADIAAITYKNAVLRGDTLDERTVKWVNTEELKQFSLIEWLFYFRFRQRNITRRIITGELILHELLRPFFPLYDSKDPEIPNRKYVLVGYDFSPLKEAYENIIAYEYDDYTEVTMMDNGEVISGAITVGEGD